MNKLLVLSVDAPKYAKLLQAADLPFLEVTARQNPHNVPDFSDYNIILGDPGLVSPALGSVTDLEWVQSTWAGVDDLCGKGLRRDYLLTGVKDVFGPAISEYVLAYIFANERQIFTKRDNQLKHQWSPLPYRRCSDILVGIAGLGSIGRHLANSLRQLGFQLSGLNRSGTSCDAMQKVYSGTNVRGFLEQPDYVVLTLPDTQETDGFINAETLGMMKNTSVLINVGRGNAIDEMALVSAINNGIIAGAVLDVFASEPLAQESPLWDLPNVLITPHTAATSFPEDIFNIFVENYRRYLDRAPMLNVVDFELGY